METQVPHDFEEKLRAFFTTGDGHGVESAILLYGAGGVVTHAVIPKQLGAECTITIDENAQMDVLQWREKHNQSTNLKLVPMGWAHSHHRLPMIAPSVSDIKHQYSMQKDLPEYMMWIAASDGRLQGFRLLPEVMSAHCCLPESVDTTTLVCEATWVHGNKDLAIIDLRPSLLSLYLADNDGLRKKVARLQSQMLWKKRRLGHLEKATQRLQKKVRRLQQPVQQPVALPEQPVRQPVARPKDAQPVRRHARRAAGAPRAAGALPKPIGGGFKEFTANCKTEHSDELSGKSAAEVQRYAGVKWRGLTEQEKAPYVTLFTAEFNAWKAAHR
jgi:hypothetical protein